MLVALTIILFCRYGTAAPPPDGAKDIGSAKAAALADDVKLPRGERYEATVPDTLDLSGRADLALHGLAGILDPKANYEFWWVIRYKSHPVDAVKDARSFAACGPKILESFPMMIAMTGNGKFQREFLGLKGLLVSWIADDGLAYCRVGPDRPWDKVCPENYANVYGQGRMMLAMMAIYRLDKNPAWLTLIAKMADGLERIAIDKGDYAYYPVNMGNDKVKMGEGYCYPKSGWYNTEEAVSEQEGVEGSMFMYHCGVIRAMARWHKMSGDEKSIRFARKLVNYVMKDKFWGSECSWPKTAGKVKGLNVLASKTVGHDRAHFTGHFHGHTAMLFALIEYANAANDGYVKEFVRSGYEYARNQGIARLGLFGETCTISDMVGTAVKLSEGGTGDYWDDVDGYVRNQLIEQQLTDAKQLQKVSNAGGASSAGLDPLIERTLGIFCDGADLGQIPNTASVQCCTGNGTQALYYAWKGILSEGRDAAVQVNLLLNRASPWMDVSSYLPYEGKVVLRNKTARTLSLRIPDWVDREAVKCAVGGKRRDFSWVGNYAVLSGLEPEDQIVFTFPVVEQTVSYTVLTQQFWTFDPRPEKNPPNAEIKYTCRFRGNTLVDFSPRPDDRWYVNYQRGRYKGNNTPMKRIWRFVTAEPP